MVVKTTTTYYELEKFQRGGPVVDADLAGNMDIIDAALHDLDIGSAPMTTSADPALNAAVTTAIVDAYSGVIITLTGAGNAQTLQSPTTTTAGSRKFTVVTDDDNSTHTIEVNGVTMSAGEALRFVWDGSAWVTITAVDADDIAFTPAGAIAAVNVQDAVEELDTEKMKCITSVDNEIARFDSTGGDVQGYSSGAPTISDTGNIVATGGIDSAPIGGTTPAAAAFTQVAHAKGADVASAAALTLGSDGNYFDITGTDAITSIATIGAGMVVTLHFDAILTFTHDATHLILPGGANITTAAGDEATLIEYAAGDWRCVAYTKADGTAVIAQDYYPGGTDVAIADGGTGAGTAADAYAALKQDATETATGAIERATTVEVVTGTDTDRAVTPAGVTARLEAPCAIGGTTPAAGSFTTLESSSTPLLKRVSGTEVAFNAVAQTTLYTVPTGKVFIPVFAAIRITADASTTAVTFGRSTALTDWLGTQTLTSLDANGDYGLVMPAISATPGALKAYAAAVIFQIDVTTGTGGATNYVDLFGYVIDA